MSFSIKNSIVALCSGDNVAIYNLDEKSNGDVINLPKLELVKKLKAHNREDIDSFHTLTSVVFSNDGQYFLVCANRKQLCLYKTTTRELVSNRTMIRAASKVIFTPLNNDIVVADKSGDAYLFSTSKPHDDGKLLLGHLSILFDILVTDDEKLIITADRDEKIRVSMFPNCYNIVSYCLGHKNFVTNVAVLPHEKNILISSGGDGTLIFWDFKSGKELSTVYFHEKLSQNDLIALNQTLKENDLDDQVSVSPVKHVKLLQVTENKSIVVVTFYCSIVILLYEIQNNKSDLNVEFLHTIKSESEPLEIEFDKDQLWILTDFNLQVFKYNEKSFVIYETLNTELEKLNKLWKNLHSNTSKTLLPILYKRKFDGVNDYQEKKKLRTNDNK